MIIFYFLISVPFITLKLFFWGAFSLKLPNRSITALLYTECIESSGPPGVVLGKFLQEWEIRKGLYNFIT